MIFALDAPVKQYKMEFSAEIFSFKIPNAEKSKFRSFLIVIILFLILLGK